MNSVLIIVSHEHQTAKLVVLNFKATKVPIVSQKLTIYLNLQDEKCIMG